MESGFDGIWWSVKKSRYVRIQGRRKRLNMARVRLKVGNKWNSSGIGRGEMKELSS